MLARMRIVKRDDELQVVYGEVYAPDFPDVDGDYMTATEIRSMAHRFLQSGKLNFIDIMHNNGLVPACVVESYIARKGDPDFIEDAWVVGVHIEDPDLWSDVKSGKYNGFSMEALVKKTPKVLEIEVPEVIEGPTQKAEGHEHTFEIRFGDNGEFLGGRTNIVNGHYHEIKRATVTDEAEGHAHRFSFVELIRNEQAADQS